MIEATSPVEELRDIFAGESRNNSEYNFIKHKEALETLLLFISVSGISDLQIRSFNEIYFKTSDGDLPMNKIGNFVNINFEDGSLTKELYKKVELNFKGEISSKFSLYLIFASLLLTGTDKAEKNERVQRYNTKKSLDYSYQLVSKRAAYGRYSYRFHAFKDVNGPGMTIRALPDRARDFSTLGMPQSLLDLVLTRESGLILVCGATGSGKTSTLISLISQINEQKKKHIVTIEDPVEFVYPKGNCLITQREVGNSVPTFGNGLRDALREAPNYILIGELRDAETIKAALEAATTGHLVLGTFHAQSAVDVIDGLITRGASNEGEKEQIRNLLAGNLLTVLIQRMVGFKIRDEEGRETEKSKKEIIFEYLLQDTAISGMIKAGKLNGIPSSLMTTGNVHLDFSIAQKIAEKKFTISQGFQYTNSQEETFLNNLKSFFNGRKINISQINEFELKHGDKKKPMIIPIGI